MSIGLHGTAQHVEKFVRLYRQAERAEETERAGETSPPFPGIGQEPGERMREDWFPVLWRAA